MTNETLVVPNLNPMTGKYESGFNPASYYQITGTGFGEKPVPTYYDNFDSRPSGSVSGSVGELNWSTSTGSEVSTSNPHSGTKSILHNFALNDFPKVYKTLANTKQLYFSCWLHFSGTVDPGSVWKFGRVGNGTVYSGHPHAGASYTSSGGAAYPQSVGSEMTASNGDIIGYSANVVGATATPSQVFTNGSWHFYEIIFDAGTVGGSDSLFVERVNGKIATRWEGLPFLNSAESGADWLLLPINGLDNSPAIVYSLDEVYITESLNRAVMTDSAAYNSSTKFSALQDGDGTNSGWADGLVYCKKTNGIFNTGETSYIHLLSGENTVIKTQQVTVS